MDKTMHIISVKRLLRPSVLCLALLACLLSPCQGYTDPVLQSIVPNPDSVGNSADSNSTISWADITQGQKYAGGEPYNDGGLGTLFDMSRSFVDTALSSGFPYDLIEKFKNGKLDMAADGKQFALDYLGYGVCIVIGFLFIIIFPIVGLCFCCCRCCGNCGGKKLQKSDPSASCRRKVYGLLFLIITVMTGIGMICGFVANEQMSVALGKMGTSSVDQLSNVNILLNNSVEQVNQVAKTNFDFVKSVVFRDLDSIGYLVGIPIRDSLGTDGQIIASMNSAEALQSTVDIAIPQMTELDSAITRLKDNITQLSNELSTAKTDIDNAMNCGGSCPFDTALLATNVDPNSLPDISSQKTTLDGLASKNMSAFVASAKKDFDTIPEKVENETATTIADLKKMFNDFSNQTDQLSGMVNDFKTNALGSVNIDDMQSQIKSTFTVVNGYDQYRWYAGVGLSCLILLIVLLNLLGLGFGICGGSASMIPTERGCLSNSGGNMLMAAVGFIFIFSPLLMLLTTLTFTVGAPLEKFLCQPIKDPDLGIVNKLLNDFVGNSNGSYLGNMLFQDPSVDLTLGGIIKDCGDGKGAWTAFKLDNFKTFNLTQLTDYRSTIDVTGQLDAIDSTVDFSSLSLLTPDLSTQLDKIKTATNGIDFSAFETELSKNTTSTDLDAFITVLKNYTDSLSPGAEKTSLTATINDLTTTKDVTLVNTQTAQTEVLNAANALNTTISGVPAQVDSVKSSLTASQTFLQNNASAILKTQVQTYINRILGTVDSFINDTLDALYNDIGKCTPIYNLFNDLLVNGLCSYIIDALNAFWFTLGWCIFFFMPSLIFGVKLAKHFRTMKYLDSFEGGKPPMDTNQPIPMSQAGSWPGKV
ncbi:prominin-1-A-like [Gigantopelta aegis]|uniref:prominin-1-A-like n=1 Tax=Gigantopelta aegis TaxID=1735272 RepID=UPI001B889E90|nr:prominin-1-A-like [Gigantopelta aegis]